MFCTAVFGHSGGLDGSGGHHDRKNGGYHYHSTSTQPYQPTFTFPRTSVQVPSYSARTTPRTTARTSARSSYWANKRAEKDAQKTTLTSKTSATLTPIFDFHNVDSDPYKVVSFTDEDASWRIFTSRQNHFRIPKSKIVRIEPIDDLLEFRTWIDSTGKFSTVAKYIALNEPLVELEKLEGRQISLPIDRLSEVDKAFLERIKSSGL